MERTKLIDRYVLQLKLERMDTLIEYVQNEVYCATVRLKEIKSLKESIQDDLGYSDNKTLEKGGEDDG